MCDKTTKNQNLLDLHLIAIHFKKELLKKYGNPENKCEICHKVFQNVDAFTFHIGKDHNLLKDIMTERLESDSNPASAESSPEVNPVSIPKIVTNDVKPISKMSLEPSKNKFECYKCGASRRGMKELYGHYSLQHFSAELKEEFGVKKQCTFEDCNKNLENITAWISHLGKNHDNFHISRFSILPLRRSEKSFVLLKFYSFISSFRPRTPSCFKQTHTRKVLAAFQ